LALCFIAINRLLSVAVTYDETHVHPEIVLVDLSTSQYFFGYHTETHMIYRNLATLAQLKSEESIRAGEHLKWFLNYNVTARYDHSPRYSDYDRPLDINSFPNVNSDTVYTVPDLEGEQYLYEGGDWFFPPDNVYWELLEEYPSGLYIIEQWLQLKTPDQRSYYSTIWLTDQTTADVLYIHEANAIRAQLLSYKSAQEYLNQIEGLLYYLAVEIPAAADSDPTIAVFSNVNELRWDAGYFKSYPVHFIMSRSDFGTYSITQTGTSSTPFHNIGDDSGGIELYIAFTPQVVDAHNQIYSAARNMYMRDFTVFLVSVILALGSTIVLMVAAGRKYKTVEGESAQANNVHFIPVDKPYLDISLALLIGWVVLIGYFAVAAFNAIWHHRNITALNLVSLAAILLTVPFALIWLTSLAKRIKAGKFWKHTLVYAIIYHCIFGFLRFIFRFVKSLWADTRLTFKVIIISCATFFTMFFVGLVGAETRALTPLLFVIVLLINSLITVLLLIYAHRIRKLERGARDVVQGKYYPPIEAGGGELGSIANSINNISAGINTAVEERLKSERLKTELITNVSHDIRTPLTSIITYTDLLDHEGLDCERAPEYLDVLKQKSLRLKTLTEELFEAAKAATGNIDVNLTGLDVVSSINQVLGELDSAVKSSGLDLRVKLPEKLYATADGRLMQRVMENLLSNVFKYSLPGSRVYIDAYQMDYSQVRIDLKNISSQELNFDPSELTERFKRGDESRADGGSGLGLSIVQSFMDAQGGRFEVSIDGDLFKATVLLPASPDCQSMPPTPTKPTAPSTPNTSP